MYDDILHLTFIRANRWMHAVELQAKRIVGPVTDLSAGREAYRTEWNQRQLDLDYFLIALNRLRLAVRSANDPGLRVSCRAVVRLATKSTKGTMVFV